MRRIGGQAACLRMLALLCLVAVIVASILAPLHKHSSRQEGACLTCQAAERATVVHVNPDQGKPCDIGSKTMAAAALAPLRLDPTRSQRSSRAPPASLLSP